MVFIQTPNRIHSNFERQIIFKLDDDQTNSGASTIEFFITISFLVQSTRMRRTLKLVVIVALTQAIVLSGLVATLGSLAPKANAVCEGFNSQGKLCGNPDNVGGAPVPNCKNKSGHLTTCRLS
jgi:hypothetical protein